MTGTGTQLDPYCITTIEDLRGMDDPDGYYFLANDIDINNTDYWSGWTTPSVTFEKLYSNGKKIRNIVTDGASIFSLITDNTKTVFNIENIIFENIKCNSIAGFVAFSGTMSTTVVNMRSCGMSGVFNIEQMGSNGLIAKTLNADLCAFNFKIIAPSMYGSYLSGVIADCNFLFDISTTSSDDVKILSAASAASASNLVKNTSIRGSVANTLTPQVRVTAGIQDCVIAISINSANSITPCNAAYGVNIVDSDIIEDGITLVPKSNVNYLTTAQMKDKVYLNSIGFAVV